MGLYKEGIEQAREASEIFERLGDTAKQAECLISLAYVLHDDKQLDGAEESASRAIDLLLEKGQQFQLCQGHRILGDIYKSKGDTEKAVYHFEAALEIASSFNQDFQLFWIHYALASLAFGQGKFDDAHAHIEHAKSHAINDAYQLGRAMERQA
jgi:tetratricopeptide (TPR) repeat protein